MTRVSPPKSMDHQHVFGPQTIPEYSLWSFRHVDQTPHKIHCTYNRRSHSPDQLLCPAPCPCRASQTLPCQSPRLSIILDHTLPYLPHPVHSQTPSPPSKGEGLARAISTSPTGEAQNLSFHSCPLAHGAVKDTSHLEPSAK